MNKVVLVGRLTKDPELRTTNSGLSVSSFTLAVNRNFKNKEGNIEADFINISIFGKQADNVHKYCFKGSQIGVEGRIQTRSYNAEDGSKRYVTDVVADNVEFLGSKKDAGTSSYIDAIPDAPIDVHNEIEIPKEDPFKDFGSEVVLSDDDLPF
jgi:single-strand DNA-binding protein